MRKLLLNDIIYIYYAVTIENEQKNSWYAKLDLAESSHICCWWCTWRGKVEADLPIGIQSVIRAFNLHGAATSETRSKERGCYHAVFWHNLTYLNFRMNLNRNQIKKVASLR